MKNNPSTEYDAEVERPFDKLDETLIIFASEILQTPDKVKTTDSKAFERAKTALLQTIKAQYDKGKVDGAIEELNKTLDKVFGGKTAINGEVTVTSHDVNVYFNKRLHQLKAKAKELPNEI